MEWKEITMIEAIRWASNRVMKDPKAQHNLNTNFVTFTDGSWIMVENWDRNPNHHLSDEPPHSLGIKPRQYPRFWLHDLNKRSSDENQ